MRKIFRYQSPLIKLQHEKMNGAKIYRIAKRNVWRVENALYNYQYGLTAEQKLSCSYLY